MYIYPFIHLSMYVSIYVSVYVSTYLYMYICVYMYMYIYMNIYTRTHIYTYTTNICIYMARGASFWRAPGAPPCHLLPPPAHPEREGERERRGATSAEAPAASALRGEREGEREIRAREGERYGAEPTPAHSGRNPAVSTSLASCCLSPMVHRSDPILPGTGVLEFGSPIISFSNWWDSVH